jgi:serine phosphatase RsbU (regulator of sigma subunit)
MAIVSILGYYIAKKSIQEQTFSKLTTIRNSKAQEITRYFQTLHNLSSCISENEVTVEAFERFNNAFISIKKTNQLNELELKKLLDSRDDYFYNQYVAKDVSEPLEKNTFLNYLPKNKEALILQNYRNDSNLKSNQALIEYQKALNDYQPFFKSFEKHTDFGNLLLINSKTGDIIYSVNNASSLGGSLLNDSLSKTNLAALFSKLRHLKEPKVEVIDYQSYFPSNFEQKAFMACPIFKNNENIGVLALRVPIDTINKIMTFNNQWELNGLGKTGETYLFGNHYKMRSNSRFLIENPSEFLNSLSKLGYQKSQIEEIRHSNSTIKNITIKTTATVVAINGKTNTKIITDYRGKEVLSAYMPLNILQFKWGITAKIETAEAFENIEVLKHLIIYSFLFVFLITVILSYIISSYVTKPINALSDTAKELSNGNFEALIKIKQKDEIGLLAESFAEMRNKIVTLISNLRIVNGNLEEKQKEIFDSIRYARKIQDNILASAELLNENLPDYFVYFNPKDIVSGDFYWAIKTSNEIATKNSNTTLENTAFYLAVCDSTGHGIPGAFMSLLNVSFLNEAIIEKNITETNEILNDVRQSLIKTFSNEENKDGMDGILVKFEQGKNRLTFSAANNKPILVRNNEYILLDADKMAIGKGIKSDSFNTYSIETQPNDMLYLISDGFPDQFGGDLNKKYKYKKLYEYLVSINSLPLSEQKNALSTEFDNWKKQNDQTDDVIVFGIRF